MILLKLISTLQKIPAKLELVHSGLEDFGVDFHKYTHYLECQCKKLLPILGWQTPLVKPYGNIQVKQRDSFPDLIFWCKLNSPIGRHNYKKRENNHSNTLYPLQWVEICDHFLSSRKHSIVQHMWNTTRTKYYRTHPQGKCMYTSQNPRSV